MISILEIFRFVLKNMFEKKSRVFLTISGIIIGIFTFTIFIFMSQGLSNAISDQFTSLGVNAIVIRSADAPGGGPPVGGGLTDTDLERIKQVIRDYKYIAPGIFYSGRYEYNREFTNIITLGYKDENLEDIRVDLGLEIREGRFLRQGDSGSVVIGARAAKESFDRELRVGNVIRSEDRNFRVVGILRERGDLFTDSAMWMSFNDISQISNQDTYSVIRVSFFESADIDSNILAINNRFNPPNRERKVNISTPQQAIDQFNQILGVLTLIISFVSSIALVVGGINVMNTMYSNVLERVNEISVMKAIGATNSDIRNIFLIESSILGLIGSLIGFGLAFGLAVLLSYLITNFAGYSIPIYFDIVFFIGVITVTSFFAMLFGTYPAIRASKINPSDNLRDD